jgi:hypothetical protein
MPALGVEGEQPDRAPRRRTGRRRRSATRTGSPSSARRPCAAAVPGRRGGSRGRSAAIRRARQSPRFTGRARTPLTGGPGSRARGTGGHFHSPHGLYTVRCIVMATGTPPGGAAARLRRVRAWRGCSAGRFHCSGVSSSIRTPVVQSAPDIGRRERVIGLGRGATQRQQPLQMPAGLSSGGRGKRADDRRASSGATSAVATRERPTPSSARLAQPPASNCSLVRGARIA